MANQSSDYCKIDVLTLKALNRFVQKHRKKKLFFQFEINLNALVSSI